MKHILLICMLSIGLNSFSMINGKVKSKSGEAIQGVSVYWLNGTNGVVTDEAGEFSIAEIEHTNKLVFSLVGYKSDTVQVSDKNITITLLEAVQTIVKETAE